MTCAFARGSRSIDRLSLYGRLAAAYDHFHETCGFLSPRMTALIEELRKPYTNSYLTTVFQPYAQAYLPACPDIAEAYAHTIDYSETYTLLLDQPAEAK